MNQSFYFSFRYCEQHHMMRLIHDTSEILTMWISTGPVHFFSKFGCIVSVFPKWQTHELSYSFINILSAMHVYASDTYCKPLYHSNRWTSSQVDMTRHVLLSFILSSYVPTLLSYFFICRLIMKIVLWFVKTCCIELQSIVVGSCRRAKGLLSF